MALTLVVIFVEALTEIGSVFSFDDVPFNSPHDSVFDKSTHYTGSSFAVAADPSQFVEIRDNHRP
jgi:hypothetical protein